MDQDFSQHIVNMNIPIHFWEFSMTDTDGYTLEDLHNNIEKIIRESGDARNRETNVKAHMTKWNMLEYKEFAAISAKATKTVEDWHREYTDLDLKTFQTTCWGSIYSKGDYSERHAHVPALYSWVYYAKVEDDSAPLYFHNDPGMYYKPTSGTGIIFPGWLEHEVQPHNGDSERVIVVGNIEGTGSVSYPQREFLEIKDF